MRPIDADAFKKYIDAHKGRLFIGCTVGEAIKILIDEQPTIQCEPRWIPVSERLPEKGGEYLVTTQWYDGDIDISLYEYSATYKEWNDGDMCGQKVIAWMPLPEPMKTENN